MKILKMFCSNLVEFWEELDGETKNLMVFGPMIIAGVLALIGWVHGIFFDLSFLGCLVRAFVWGFCTFAFANGLFWGMFGVVILFGTMVKWIAQWVNKT
jgi:hypothetical protein